MQLCHLARYAGAISAVLLAGLFCTPLLAQTTYVIDSLGDEPSDQNDAQCLSTVGTCTLRTALQSSFFADPPITIEVDAGIATGPSGKSVIEVTSPLPPILVQTTIAGDSHPGFEGNGFTNLVIAGVSGVSEASGLVISGASGTEIRNIGIHGFGENAILLTNGGNYSIRDNVLGGSWVDSDVNTPGNGGHGLHMANASSPGNITVVQDNVILANEGNGIRISDDTSAAVVQGNIIGLRPPLFSPGAFRPLNGNGQSGIYIRSNAGPGNHIGFFGGNTIANNEGPGVLIQADFQEMRGNLIGVPHDGEVAPGFERSDYGNDSMVNGFAVRVQSDGNIIGSSGAGRNTIGQSNIGVFVQGSDNALAWNRVGVDADGNEVSTITGISIGIGQTGNEVTNNTLISNSSGINTRSQSLITRNTILDATRGIRVFGATQIGSTAPEDANVIGSSHIGIEVYAYTQDAPSAVVAIRNNLIGTNADGDDLGNDIGIQVRDEDNRVWIGQIGGSGNVIGYNAVAIDLRNGASEVLIAGNHIGIHPNGQPIPNLRAVRVQVGTGMVNNQIGFAPDAPIDPASWSPGNDAGNVIAYNLAGIDLSQADAGTFGNSIRGNQFFDNDPDEGLGIDLGMDSVDIGGANDGPNTLLNYPEIDPQQTSVAGMELTYRYRVRTSGMNAEYPLTIDFYLASPSDTAQGVTFLGSDEYPVTSAGNYRTGTLFLLQPLSAEEGLVAIATDGAGNTSQFTLEPVMLEVEDGLFEDRFESL